MYGDLPTHRKSVTLAALLGDPRAWTHVVELWLWVSRHAPEGDLGQMPDAAIAHVAGWRGDASAFVAALRTAGFLDETRIHDWYEHNGAHFRKQAADKTRNSRVTNDKQVKENTVTSESPVSHQNNGSVESIEYRIKNTEKNVALFLTEKDAAPGKEPKRRGRPPKDQSPEAAAEREAEKADGERWMTKARSILGLDETQARWSTATWMAFRRARKARGVEQLMQALEGLTGDKFSATAGLGWLISDNGITKGLAKFGAGASGVHVSRVQHRVGSSADGYDPFL